MGILKIKRLDIALTTACNFSCKYCRGNPGNRKKLPFEDVIKIIDNFRAFNLKEVRLDGGEPFLYGKEIFSIIDYTYKNTINTGVFTNASLFNEELIDKLTNYPHLKLFVTLHSINPETEIGATLKGLSQLAGRNIFPELIIIISRKHLPTIHDILSQIPQYGYQITFRPIIPVGKAFDNWEEGFASLRDEDKKEFFGILEEIKAKFSHLIFQNLLPGENTDGYHDQDQGFILHVNTDGILLPSFAAPSAVFLGSALDKTNLLEKLSDPNISSYLKNADSAILDRILKKSKPTYAHLNLS